MRQLETQLINPSCSKFLVGNKIDEKNRKVYNYEASHLAFLLDLIYIETSSTNNNNFDEVLNEIVEKLVNSKKFEEKKK